MHADEPMTSGEDGRPEDALSLPPAHAEAAELVRRHLLVLRGGVLFLSSQDGAALVRWLDGGVPVARILGALETAAERRRVRAERGPLTLSHAGRFLNRTPTAPAPRRVAPVVASPDPVGRPLDGLVDAFVPAGLAAQFPGPTTTLRYTLDAVDGAPEEVAARAIAAIGQFFEACWESLGDAGRARYVSAASASLGDLGDLMAEEDLAILLEQYARGLLRAEAPGLCADAVLVRVRL